MGEKKVWKDESSDCKCWKKTGSVKNKKGKAWNELYDAASMGFYTGTPSMFVAFIHKKGGKYSSISFYSMVTAFDHRN